MKEIFTELYKKVLGFFQTQEKEENENKSENAKVACNRLKLVLMQDRTNLTPYLLERMRGEMIDVLSKYVEMDKEALELNFEQEGEQMALMLSIPVVRAKDEEEIQAVIDAEEKARAEKEATEATEESDEVEDESEDSEKTEDTEVSETEEVEIAEKTELEATEEKEEEKTCSCGEDCTCGCQEGEECTCETEDKSEKSSTSEKKHKNKK